ncbi:MAG: hypothetical protein LKI04_26480 [Paenibacillus lautus]|uniref:hypothetical protein n=1 Tax=Paenibacillus lautus TaxID=1401 RepID=UPI0026F1BD07|nr:hypothetical protein [Paenibacillus lautus]MCI1777562.1 hypothetical protein [Paenibacillus lautus]
MKNSNLIIIGLLLFICFLIYQNFDIKQDMKSISPSQPPIVVPNGFEIYGQTNGSSNQDGYWLYKDDEKIIYFFEYDPETNKINKIQRNLYE